MKIFVAGGTGVLGQKLVPKLLDQGHQVGILHRQSKRSHVIQSLGAAPVNVDIFDEHSIISATKGYDIFIHIATSIPKSGVHPDDWKMNCKLRIEGTKNLLTAAVANKASLYIQQSITFHYGHRNGDWVDENTIITNPYPQFAELGQEWLEIANNTLDMENIVKQAIEHNKIKAVILRGGWFMALSTVKALASGSIQIIDNGEAFWNVISVDHRNCHDNYFETYEAANETTFTRFGEMISPLLH